MHLPQLRDQQCQLMQQVQLCYERIQYSHRVDFNAYSGNVALRNRSF